uniref:Fibronectin type-III domain-containing protein n=1 Tax=Amphimedon queenslandica TaxID=400682 RepID=A0A1X7UF27_AMPQE
MLGKMLISVLSLSLAIYSVDSCSTVSRSGVSLTGICPNDSFIVPVGTTLSYECTIGGFTQDYVLYWNVSGTAYNCFNYKPPGISVSLDGSFKIMPNNSEYYIQCGMCKGLNCLLSDDVQEFIATKSIQLIAFGPPSSLSHELRDNDTVKLSWSTPSLPPSVNEDDVSFTYNIMIMESTNSSLTVTDINITNSSKISNELAVINDTIEFNVTGPCDILSNDTYTLLQRDYCQTQLNSSQLNMSILDDSVVLLNMLISISVKITSLIHDSTWSVAVNVSDRFGSDTTDYTNITDNSEAIQDCNPMTSSSVSQASSSNILSSVMTFVNKVKGLKLIDTSMVSRITIESSPVSSADIVNENYGNVETSFQTDQATPDSELATHQYAVLDEISSDAPIQIFQNRY